MSDYTVNTVKAYVAHSQSLVVGLRAEGCMGWYPCSIATGGDSPVPLRSISGQKRAADGYFITCEVGEAPVTFRKARLMTMFQACRIGEVVQV